MPGPFGCGREGFGLRIVWREDFRAVALEAAAEPPAGGDVHTNPSVEAHNHAECPSNSQVARCGGVACV